MQQILEWGKYYMFFFKYNKRHQNIGFVGIGLTPNLSQAPAFFPLSPTHTEGSICHKKAQMWPKLSHQELGSKDRGLWVRHGAVSVYINELSCYSHRWRPGHQNIHRQVLFQTRTEQKTPEILKLEKILSNKCAQHLLSKFLIPLDSKQEKGKGRRRKP